MGDVVAARAGELSGTYIRIHRVMMESSRGLQPTYRVMLYRASDAAPMELGCFDSIGAAMNYAEIEDDEELDPDSAQQQLERGPR